MTIEDKRYDSAQRAADIHNNSLARSFDATIQFATLAMRAPALIAAGGIAALLAFYSANSQIVNHAKEEFNTTLLCLMSALVLSSATTGITYFSQYYYTMATANEELTWQHPYVLETNKSKKLKLVGTVFHIVSILMIISSYLLIFYSGYLFLAVLQAM